MNRNRAFVFLIVSAVFGVSLFGPALLGAQEEAAKDEFPALTLETGPVFLVGTARELVYKQSGSDDLLSRLVYPIPPSLGVFAQAKVKIAPIFEAGLRIETVWPLSEGNLTDDDWIGISSSLDPNIHSDSAAYLTSYLKLRFELAFPIDLGGFELKPLLGLVHRNLAWEAWNGIQTSGATVTYLYGQVIDYRQTWWIPYFGVGASYEDELVRFYGNLRFSPYAFANDRDIHILTGRTYSDFAEGGFVFMPELGFSLKFNKVLALDLGLSLEFSEGQRGYIITSVNGSSSSAAAYSRSNDVAGIDYQEFSASLGLRFNF